MPLTVKRVERLTKPGKYLDGNGLLLRIQGKSRHFAFRYSRGGVEHTMSLGSIHTLTLDEARERARQARVLLLDGIDPIADRKARRNAARAERKKVITFRECALGYHASHDGKWKSEKHSRQILSTLEAYAYPTIGDLSVADIDRALIIKCVEPHWKRKPETMRRTLARMAAVLAWASARGYRSSDNPAIWTNNLDKVLPSRRDIAKIKHHPALPFDDLPDFMLALAEREGVAARALAFTILTAARTGEVIGAREDEIDLDARIWIVPAERMKAGKIHRVPLVPAAIDLLKALPREDDNPFLFIGGKKDTPLSNMSMLAVLKRMERSDLTVHGFRSTFRDWAAERSSFPRDVVEMALAHTIGDKVEAAYRRGDLFVKRTKLMLAWANFALSPKVGSVLPMRRVGEVR